MPLLSFGGWTFGVSIPDWLNAALMQARFFQLSTLAAEVSNQNLRIVDMMNWTISELLEKNPSINQTIDYPNLVDATTLGSNLIPIPDDLMGQDIISMKFYDSQQAPWQLLSDCLYIGWYGWNQLDPQWRNGTFGVRDPAYWTFDGTAQNQLFAPYPNDATVQLERTYRPNPTLIAPPTTGSMLSSGQLLPGSVATVAGSPIVQGTNTRFTSAISQLSGLLSNPVTSADVTGVGTAFTTELVVGSVIEYADGTSRTVGTITNDTALILTLSIAAAHTNVIGFKIGGTPLANAVTLAAGTAVVINEIPSVISSVSSATVLTLVQAAQSTLSGVSIVASTIVGEIPYRFKQVPIYRLAAYLAETTDMNLYAELMAKYQASMAAMQNEITKQLATQNANMSKQARPNNVMDLNSLYPSCSYYNNYI